MEHAVNQELDPELQEVVGLDRAMGFAVNLQRQMWHCACCGVGNISKSALANPDPTSYPELYNDTVEYRVLHQDGLQRPGARKHIVVAVDATMDAALLHNLQKAVLQTLE
eukprot:scaffold167517_cov27-Tisochrysis_lutea.AAC.1